MLDIVLIYFLRPSAFHFIFFVAVTWVLIFLTNTPKVHDPHENERGSENPQDKCADNEQDKLGGREWPLAWGNRFWHGRRYVSLSDVFLDRLVVNNNLKGCNYQIGTKLPHWRKRDNKTCCNQNEFNPCTLSSPWYKRWDTWQHLIGTRIMMLSNSDAFNILSNDDSNINTFKNEI